MSSNTFSQIYIQVVFAVKNREALIDSFWKDELYKYITGIVQAKEQKMLAINGTHDHIHFLIGMKPSCCLSDLVRKIKKSANRKNIIEQKHLKKNTSLFYVNLRSNLKMNIYLIGSIEIFNFLIFTFPVGEA
ncbi:MAG: transposase [Planctomycetaceae bacterium]|jgi:REP element-mobilizing transposase RayT|nr:transposase [Planctomycetaceae bacterium]